MHDPAQVPLARAWPELLERAEVLLHRPSRSILGIAGAPGSGKSTVAGALAAALGAAAVVVPMDGFHLADIELVRLGRRRRKGAPDTFDPHGYAALLRRLHEEQANTVYAPAFDRDVEQPVAGSIPVTPQARLVLTEGNYLLLPDPAWERARQQLDEVWFCELDDDERLARLVARHERFGKEPTDARAWVGEVDEPNARRVAATRGRADLVVPVAVLHEIAPPDAAVAPARADAGPIPSPGG